MGLLEKGDATVTENIEKNDSMYQTVRNAYADIAAGRAAGCCGFKVSCCGAEAVMTIQKNPRSFGAS